MRWYINDASLQGQFTSDNDFLSVLRDVFQKKSDVEILDKRLFVSRYVIYRPVVRGRDFRNVVDASVDKKLRSAVLYWLNKKGPFIEDALAEEEENYFECQGVDVTDSGLGEAVRRMKGDGEAAGAFSFCGGDIDFSYTPLIVQHGLSEDIFGCYAVDNYWSAESLSISALETLPPPNSWRELVEYAKVRFPKLIIPDAVYENPCLSREPFDAVIRDRLIALFDILNKYMAGRDAEGVEGAGSREILQAHFSGTRALFSPESVTNKNVFKEELTFDDPLIAGDRIFAHWHGKISHRFFRVHFEWPVPATTKHLKVVYFGPKLTK